jgi:hypothetical protein
MSEFNPHQPVHVGTLNGMPLRFYAPQTDDDMMPWVAMEDLASALGMNRTARRALREANKNFPDMAKRIPGEDGAQVCTCVSGCPGPLGRAEGAGICRGLHLALVQELMAAAEKASPLLFDRNANGETVLNSHMLSMLLGESHEPIVARIKADGIPAKEVPAPQRH